MITKRGSLLAHLALPAGLHVAQNVATLATMGSRRFHNHLARKAIDTATDTGTAALDGERMVASMKGVIPEVGMLSDSLQGAVGRFRDKAHAKVINTPGAMGAVDNITGKMEQAAQFGRGTAEDIRDYGRALQGKFTQMYDESPEKFKFYAEEALGALRGIDGMFAQRSLARGEDVVKAMQARGEQAAGQLKGRLVERMKGLKDKGMAATEPLRKRVAEHSEMLQNKAEDALPLELKDLSRNGVLELEKLWSRNHTTGRLLSGVGKQLESGGYKQVAKEISSDAAKKMNRTGNLLGMGAVTVVDPLTGVINAAKKALITPTKIGPLAKAQEWMHSKFLTNPVKKMYNKGAAGEDIKFRGLRRFGDSYLMNPITADVKNFAYDVGRLKHRFTPVPKPPIEP